ncbi:MAG: Beta-galactosidase [Phycisphaerae bacterium]|nr:Beta-galactosidase [Phycisphaerae bacterium]
MTRIAVGTRLGWLLLFLLPSSLHATDARPAEQDLSGRWQWLPGHAEIDVAASPEKFAGWQEIDVPGIWPDGRQPCAWQMVRFEAPESARGMDCELLFERVHWNAQVWLNGRKLGGCADGYAPFRLPATGAIKAGDSNVLVVRVGGYEEVPKARCGRPLYPAGFAMSGRGGGGGIMGRVFVRYFNKVRLTRVQVIPDLAASAARAIVRVEGDAPEATVELAVYENTARRVGGPDSSLGTASAVVKLVSGVGEATIAVAIRDVRPWTPADPYLYDLMANVTEAGSPGDRVVQRFGMREVATRSDGFYLNGRKVRLLGTNIIGDMGYWRGAPNLVGREKIKAAIIDPARAMNAVCIRTHTAPIPAWWLDVCDEEGLLVLLEFPVTVNCSRIDFDDTEKAAFFRNLSDEASAIVPYLANHPSIAMWVMTNESNNWADWERTTLWKHFKSLDPSRPAIRASYDTPDARDIHSYAAVWKGSDGDFAFRCRKEAEQAARDKVPAMISEYLDGADARVTRKWFGPRADGDPDAREKLADDVEEFRAARGMEQTEAARRLGYACILPFGPGFYAPGPNRPARPQDFAVSCALAPVGVSIDLDNRHFVAGQSCSTDVWVMNDTDAKATARVGLFLLGADPGWDPAAVPGHVIRQAAFDVEVDAHATATRSFKWQAPAAEGRYVLLARLQRDGAAPVISRRTIYAIPRTDPPAAIKGRKILVVEEPDAAGKRKLSDWIAKVGCQPVAGADLLAAPPVPLVVIAPGAASGEAFRAVAGQLPGYVQRGGHVLVLEQTDWPKLKDLLGVAVERTDYDYDDNNAPADERTDSVMAHVSQAQASGGSSRVFRWEQPQRAIWKGIPDHYLFDWNGMHGRVARVSMSTLPGRARVLVKYAEAERDDLKFVPVAAVGHVSGEVLYFMLQVDGRFDSADPDFDPVVERLMINLLEY